MYKPPRIPNFKMPKNDQGSPVLYILVLAFFIGVIYFSISGENLITAPVSKEVPISQIQKQYDSKELSEISVKGNTITAKTKSGDVLTASRLPTDGISDLGFDRQDIDTQVTVKDESGNKFWMDILAGVIPFALVALFLMYMLRQAQGQAGAAFSFGKSKAKMYSAKKQDITFKDIAGSDEVKEELVEIVDFLKNPKKYQNMGAKIPRGVLMMGPPGTGKTLMARAVAGEAKVPYFSISGSEFVEMFVGVGASRVRDLFATAKAQAPSIIFIDEIDAVGRQRGAGLGGGNDEREQTLNQILSEMDGFEKDTSVIVIAATNRPDVLDPALLRPGRFDRQVVLDRPSLEDREKILLVHAKEKPISKKVDFKIIAKHTPGFAGADLENLMNEAAIRAAKLNQKEIEHIDIEKSIEKVMMGPEKKTRLLSEEEKKITAYHEAGHAIVGHFLPNCDPVHKISIISRGMSLGVTWFLPERDTHLQSKAKFYDELASLLGGRVAEEIIFGKENITTGASNDLERVSKMARKMVTEYGMSEKLGNLAYGDKQGSVFLGREIHDSKTYSDETAREIDKEVREIVDTSYNTAKDILAKHKKELEKLTQVLLDKEVVSKEDFLKIIG